MKNDLLRLLLMVIKRTLYGFLILVVTLSTLIANDGLAQYENVKDIDVKVELKNASLEDAINAIESVTSFKFTFEEKDLRTRKGINVKSKHQKLDLVLLKIAEDANVEFKQVNNNIHIKASAKDEIVNYIKAVQDRIISGNVTSTEDNSGIPGVNVIVKGTSTGTVTDVEGNYSFEIPDGSVALVFSSVGFVTEEVAIGNQSVIDLVMKSDITALEEIVVIGYGTQQKVNLTGAVGIASGEVLENRPIANVGEGLKGVIPNLNVTIRNGDPSRSIDFNIRGMESINGGKPLVLVDGVPMDFNKLNPNDIESISVLKDAAAAAVYGARAAFGVVLVTTKRGKTGKMNVSFGAEFAAAKPIMFIDPITDPYQFVLARNMANQRTNGADAYDQDYIDGTKRWSENPTEENAWGVFNGSLRFYGYNNYQDRIITEFAPQQKYDMSISGATDKAAYFVSFGYLNKDGYLKNKEKNENFKRYNVLMKGDYEINKWLRMDSRVLLTTEKNDRPHFYNWDVNINTTARVNPLNPIQFPDLPFYLQPGDRGDFEQYIGMYFQSVNFLPYLENGGRDTFTSNDIVLTQGATLTPLKGLNIRGEFSANYRYLDQQNIQSRVTVVQNTDLAGGIVLGNGFSGNDWIDNRANNNQYYVFNAYADYTIENNNGHYLKAMIGFNQEWGTNQYIRAKASTLITPTITDLNATTGSQETFGGKSHVSLRGAFYRVNYIFKDRYLIEFNGRYDGTSRFPKDDRFGFFPSFSAGWRISNESFMSGTSNWLDNLKLRASYGTLGNQLLGNDYYPYIPTMGSGASPYMMAAGARTPYVSAAGLVSPTLTWESVTTTNFGLDFTMLNSRLDVAFDVYTRDTKDMLMGVTYPDILGTRAPKSNAADLRTSGWELAATWRNRINTNWDYGITLALSDNKSEITKYENPTGALNEYYVGQIIGERWGYETVGIFQTEAEVAEAPDQTFIGANWRPGDIRYADLNGDGVVDKGQGTLEDPGDQKIIAYERPRNDFGITGDVGYKAFTLSLFFQGTLKYDYWPTNNNWVAFYPFNAGHVENYYLTDTWSPENPDAYFAAPHISTNTKQNIQPQSRYVQDASYIRLKNLTFAYNLPPEVAAKVGLVNASIYFAGMNLWEATKMRKPLDPEVRPTLTQEYYKQRIYSLGLKITF